MTPQRPQYKHANRFDEGEIADRLRAALAGRETGDAPGQVVWEQRGSEALVHVDRLQVRLLERVVVAAVDLETAETGRGPVVVRLVLGGAQDPAGLVAFTDAHVRGHPVLATRWGDIVRDVFWSALLRIARDHAGERGLAPQAIRVVDGHLVVRPAPATPLKQLVLAHLDPAVPRLQPHDQA